MCGRWGKGPGMIIVGCEVLGCVCMERGSCVEWGVVRGVERIVVADRERRLGA